jgi:hypothetical protein
VRSTASRISPPTLVSQPTPPLPAQAVVKAVVVSAVAVAAVAVVARVAVKAVAESVAKLIKSFLKKRSVNGRFFLYLHPENQELTK